MKLAKLGPSIKTADLRTIKEATPQRGADARERKRFYDSAAWQRARKAKLQRDPLCQACAALGFTTPAQHVDHATPLAQGGHPTAADNLCSLCLPCHSRKTVAEQAGGTYAEITPNAPARFCLR